MVLSQEGYTVRKSKDERLEPRSVAQAEPSVIVFAPARYSANLSVAVEPLRLDGRTASIPVLVCGSGLTEDCSDGLRDLGCETLNLPFDLDHLFGAIERLMMHRSDEEPVPVPAEKVMGLVA